MLKTDYLDAHHRHKWQCFRIRLVDKSLKLNMQLTDKLKNKNLYELVRFFIVGGLATVVDLLVTTVLFFATDFNENAITSLALIIAFWVSFFGHRYFTFKKKGSPVKFFVLAISTLLLRNLIVFLLVTVGIHGYAALLTAIVVVTAITYFFSKYKVFIG